MDKFKVGDYVRATRSQRLLTGTIVSQKDVQGRYLVKYDSKTNDTSLFEEGLYYEDELESCAPPKMT